jgi:hypothetical protein
VIGAVGCRGRIVPFARLSSTDGAIVTKAASIIDQLTARDTPAGVARIGSDGGSGFAGDSRCDRRGKRKPRCGFR